MQFLPPPKTTGRLYLSLFDSLLLLLVGARHRTPLLLVVVFDRLLLHLQALLLLLVLGLLVAEPGLYLGRVHIGVEVGHDGEDDAHSHQQRGEQDVLSPLGTGDRNTSVILHSGI